LQSPRRCQAGREGSGCLWGAPRSAARWRLVARGLRPVGRRDPEGTGWRRTAFGRIFALCARGSTRSVVAFMYERVDDPPPPPPPPTTTTTTARAVPSSTSFSAARPARCVARPTSLHWRSFRARCRAPHPARLPARGDHPSASETSGRVPPRSAVKEQLTHSHSSSSREKRRRLLPERRACFFPARSGPSVLPIHAGVARESSGGGGS